MNRKRVSSWPSLRQPLVAVFAIGWVVTNASPSWAQDSDLDQLRAQIERLSEKVDAQSNEIEALKQQLEDQSPSGRADVPERIAPPASTAPVTKTPASTATVAAAPQNDSNPQTVARQEIGRLPDDAYVRAGDFDGSIVLPGTTASVRIGGYVQTDLGFDFDSLGFSDALNLRTIPLDGSASDGEQVFRAHGRYSRLNFDVRSETEIGQFRTFIEVDFFGSGSDFTNNHTPVLRHAAAAIGDLYFGQFWSYFTDVSAFSEGISSPLGQPLVRNPGVRWRTGVGDGWSVAIGIEDPAGDLTGDAAQLASDSTPNVTGYVQVEKSWGHVRLAGLGLQLESTTDSRLAGGLHLSGRLNVPLLDSRDNLAFSFQGGTGFAHFYATLSNAGLEGVVAADGTVKATGILSGYVAYQHWWSDSLRSTFKASVLDFNSPDGSDALALDNGLSFGANLFWSPLDTVTFGLELVTAEREVVDGQQGSGARLSALARFDF